MMWAAGSGNLELIQWLRAEGCPWDEWTCSNAVHYGHVEVLRWARENGCPWTAEDRDQAAEDLGYTDDLGNDLGPTGGTNWAMNQFGTWTVVGQLGHVV